MIFLVDACYFAMRLARKALLPRDVPRRWARWIPGMNPSVGSVEAARIVRNYRRHFRTLRPAWVQGATVLEVGIGETNATGYELAAQGAARCYAFEPFAPLDDAADREALRRCEEQHGRTGLRECVTRINDTATLGAGVADIILSNSVLEHVGDLDAVAAELRRLLAPGGCMLHRVDYRDHFFAFPYHHLLWSDRVWERFLNPGDLPRWRIGDHVAAFRRHGCMVKVLHAGHLPDEFAKVRGRVHPRFAQRSEEDLRTTTGVLCVTAQASSSSTAAA